MRRTLTALTLLLTPALLAPAAQGTEAGLELADSVRRRVERSFCYRNDLDRYWPSAVWEAAREEIRQAPDTVADRAAVNRLLAKLESSHSEVIPRAVFDQQFGAEQQGKDTVRFGLEIAPRVVEGEKRWFLGEVLAGGPAWHAGLKRGDEVTAIDGVATGASSRGVLFGDRGVPWVQHLLLAGDAPTTLSVRTSPHAAPIPVRLEAAPWSRIKASRATVRTIDRAGLRLGYIRLYHVLHPDQLRLLEGALEGPLAGTDAIILDLRGWGGRVDVLSRILAILPGGRRQQTAGPVIALIDERTRSAKEIAAFHLKGRGVTLVGRRTAGAVLACDFFEVSDDYMMMLPVRDVPSLSNGTRLEGAGVAPHREVPDDLPFASGSDAVFEAGVGTALEAIAAARIAEAPAPPTGEPELF